jgi:L-ribulose-5-phosphate 3-epimerase UlaE
MTMCLSGHRKYPLGSHTPEVRQRGQEILRKAIEFAGDIGLRVVQVMAYDVFYETSDEETRASFLEGLEYGTRWAAQSGVMLGLENLDTPFVDNLRKGLVIIHEINSPWLRLYPDMGNLAAVGYYPPEEVLLARGLLLGIHIKDHPRGALWKRNRTVPGDLPGVGRIGFLGHDRRRDVGKHAPRSGCHCLCGGGPQICRLPGHRSLARRGTTQSVE